MHTYFISRCLMKRLVLFSLAVMVINMLTFRYLASADLENIDFSYVEGHTIMIDAGHGGIDSGARYNNLLEKDITLAISMKLGELLAQHGAIVLYTREGDVDYYTKGKGGKRNDLLQRLEMINGSNADVFVSIHCNAAREAQWFGAQVFYNPKFEANKRLAEAMQIALKKFPPNNKRQVKQDLQILILNTAEIPGVLVETGYLSNRNEAALLSDAAYQQELAGQMTRSLAYYFRENKG